MHPEGYLDRLASTKQVSDVNKVVRGQLSLILLLFSSVSVFVEFRMGNILIVVLPFFMFVCVVLNLL